MFYLNCFIDFHVSTLFTNNINTAGSDARSGIEATQNDFNTKADLGTISNLNTAKSDSDAIVSKAQTGAYGSQINDDQVNRFKDVSNATYKGLNALADSNLYSDTQSKLNKANDYVNNSKTDEGRFSLLQNAFDKPTYTQGQKGLDNLLIQGSVDVKNNIKNAATNLGDLQSNWDTANTAASAKAAERTGQSNEAKKYAQNLLGKSRDEQNTTVNNNLNEIQSKWSDQYNRLNNTLSGYKGGDLELSADDVKTLGIDKDGQQIYKTLQGMPASNYLDLQTYDASKAVSKDNFAQLAALDKLGNQYGLGNVSKFSDPNLAGTISLENNVDGSRFGKAAVQGDAAFKDYAANTNVSGSSGRYSPDDPDFFIQADINNTLSNQIAGTVASPSYVYGRGKRGDNTQATATAIAQQNFMNQLNELLNQQGYNNRIKVKG